jgi:flavodoxin I
MPCHGAFRGGSDTRGRVMKKALIVSDSVFGNTAKIADAVRAGLGGRMGVAAAGPADVKTDHLTPLPDLIFVGSPTRGFRPLSSIVQWIGRIPPDGLKGVAVAAFDTRMAAEDIKSHIGRFVVSRFGYAAESILKRLLGKGAVAVAPPEGFFVKASEGPLKDGEMERAADWARRIGESL